MLLADASEVFRALTKEKIATEKSFRLRPNEDSLSVALTPEKAMGSLSCKGYARLDLRRIRAIPGLCVQVKRQEIQPDPTNLDEDLLEIMGLPLPGSHDEGEFDYALALVKTVIECVSVVSAQNK